MYYERFEALCKERNVTPADVSRGTGIATATLTNWKKGRYTPKAAKLQQIADFFGVPLTYFTTDQESGQPEYYIDPETAKLTQMFLTDPDYRLLYEAARGSRPEDVRMAADMLKRFKEARRE